jgi:outer membrane lipoprotein-sorting protein
MSDNLKPGKRHRVQGTKCKIINKKNPLPPCGGGTGWGGSCHDNRCVSTSPSPQPPFACGQKRPSARRPVKRGGDIARSLRIALAMGFACLLIISPTISAHAMSGREVYEKVHEVRSRALDRKTEATMVLFDKGRGKRTRTLTEYSKKADPEAYKVLVIFNSPPDLKGVGFLIHARTFAERDLWAYFPEYKRVRRIPTSSQDDSFFGSDFSYDDFGGPPDLDDYRFKILKEENIDGKPCYVVEVTPKVRRKYTKYIGWVAKDLWIHLKVEYYQDDDIYRSGVFRDVRIIDGIPTPFRVDVENRKTGHRTDLTIENIKYHTKFSNDMFSQRSLERSGR